MKPLTPTTGSILVAVLCLLTLSALATNAVAQRSPDASVVANPSTSPNPTANSAWAYQTVSTDDSFSTICMALDSYNNPHVVYVGDNGWMYYTSWNGSSWVAQTVIQRGSPNSLAVDNHNNPHILYKGANGVMYYASLNASGWSFQVAPAGSDFSLALDSAGNPHLAYVQNLPVQDYPPGVTNDFCVLNYASWNGKSWSVQTVDSPVSSSDSISLAFDSHGKPHIMYGYDDYYPPTGGNLESAKFATWNGSDWNTQTAASELDWFGSMALDANDVQHFVYVVENQHDSIFGDLGYATWNGSYLTRQTIISNNSFGFPIAISNLILDNQGTPHIEFFNGSLMYATLSGTGTNWDIQTVAPNNFAYNAGPLVIDTKGNPSICYWVDDIQNTTAFVSRLLIASPNPLPAPSPQPTSNPTGTAVPTASASLLWSYTTAWGGAVSAPVASNGYIYAAAGSSSGFNIILYCLNASTGSEVWNQTGYPEEFTLADGSIYVRLVDPDAVLCLNASTGAQIWNSTDISGFGPPVVEDGVVVVGGISALNASTGERIWGESLSLNPLPGPVLFDGRVYGISSAYTENDATDHSAAFAFNVTSGEELWNYTAPGAFNSLAVDNQTTCIGSSYDNTENAFHPENVTGSIFQGGIFALDASSGKLIWNYTTGGSVEQPITAGGTVYAVTSDGVIYAFNETNGAALWSYTAGTGLGAPFLANGYLYVGSSSGAYCLNAQNGAVVWNFAESDFEQSSPTLPTYADGVIYFGWNGPNSFAPSLQHNFYAVNAFTGEELWNYTIDYAVYSPPAVENGTVYVGGNFVTTMSPDNMGAGALFALKPTVAYQPPPSPSPAASLTPAPTPSIPEFPAKVALLVLLLASALALTLGRKRTTSSRPT